MGGKKYHLEEEGAENLYKWMTPKQKVFVTEYLKDFNATKAAIRAGYSPKTAYSIGPSLLRKQNIAAYIEAKRKEMDKKLDLTVDAVVDEWRRMAMADMTDFVEFGSRVVKNNQSDSEAEDDDGFGETIDPDGLVKKINYIYLKNSNTVNGKLIKSIRAGRDGVTITLVDKEKALENLAKFLGILDKDEKKPVEVVVKLPERPTVEEVETAESKLVKPAIEDDISENEDDRDGEES